MNLFDAMRATMLEGIGTLRATQHTVGCRAGSCGGTCPTRFHGVKLDNKARKAFWATYTLVYSGTVPCARCGATVTAGEGNGELAHYVAKAQQGSGCVWNIFPTCPKSVSNMAPKGEGSLCNWEVEQYGPVNGYEFPTALVGDKLAGSLVANLR